VAAALKNSKTKPAGASGLAELIDTERGLFSDGNRYECFIRKTARLHER
jgi:hypothetical protein